MTNECKTNRPLVFAFCCALCCSLVPTLVACASEQPAIVEVPSDQEVIQDGIRRTLDPLKSPTRDSLAKYFERNTLDDTEVASKVGFDVYELLTHALRGFSYSIDSVDVQGNAATANITITHIDTAEAVQQAVGSVQQVDSLQQIADLYNSEDPAMHDELGKQLVQRLYSCLDASQTMAGNKVALTLAKSGNEWVVDDKSVTKLVDSLFSEHR